jgi:phosphate-selective porin
VWVRGNRLRAGVQARWTPGPLSIASEYIRVSDERAGQSRDGSDLTPLLARGWYVSGAWTFMTRRLGSIKPGARLERLVFGGSAGGDDASMSPRASQVLGNRETAMTVGVMWRPNRWIGVEGNLVREQIGGASLASPRMQFGSRLVRLALFL